MQNLSIQGKNSKLLQELSRNQNYFSSCQRQKSPAQSGATASIHLQSPLLSTHHCLRVPATFLCPQIINGGFWGVRINQNLCKEKPYLYLTRSSQAQQVWVKNMVMIQNKPEIYLWPTIKKSKREQNQNQNRSSSLCPNSCFHTTEGMGRSA